MPSVTPKVRSWQLPSASPSRPQPERNSQAPGVSPPASCLPCHPPVVISAVCIPCRNIGLGGGSSHRRAVLVGQFVGPWETPGRRPETLVGEQPAVTGFAPLAQWQSTGLLIRGIWVRPPGGAPLPRLHLPRAHPAVHNRRQPASDDTRASPSNGCRVAPDPNGRSDHPGATRWLSEHEGSHGRITTDATSAPRPAISAGSAGWNLAVCDGNPAGNNRVVRLCRLYNCLRS